MRFIDIINTDQAREFVLEVANNAFGEVLKECPPFQKLRPTDQEFGKEMFSAGYEAGFLHASQCISERFELLCKCPKCRPEAPAVEV